MEEKLSEVLDNILGLLLLEGSYDIQDSEGSLNVSIETSDAGRLIGFKGESLNALQTIVNQIMFKGQQGDLKHIILDVGGWREAKESELTKKANDWIAEVKETGREIELEPMPSWQRRIVHMVIQDTEGVTSESMGEGADRHLVISPAK